MLAIDQFHTTYHLPATRSGRAEARRLDALVRGRLERALADVARFPAHDADAVYRIRRLDLDLWLDPARMTADELARRWRDALLRALARAIQQGTPLEVVRYESRAQYLAAFLADLADGQAWGRWVYEEFAVLRDVRAGQAAVYVLAEAPGLVVPVASILERSGQLDRVLSTLSAADAALLWDRALGLGALPDRLPLDGRLREALERLGPQVGHPLRGDAAEARARLRHLFVLAGGTSDDLRRAATLALHLARLQRAAGRLRTPTLWTAFARGEVASAEAVGAALAPLAAPVRAWLVGLLEDDGGRAYLARLVRATAPEVAEAAPSAPLPARQRVSTAFAGLALLLPTVCALGLDERLGRDGLYQLLLAAAGRRMRPLALADAGPALLAGVEPEDRRASREAEVEWPTVGDEGPGDEVEVAFGEGPAAEVAAGVVRAFAARLRGFRESGLPYLLEQFVVQPGTLILSPDALDAHLAPPLGVILRLSGHGGDRGALPWLDGRRLTIHLPDA